MTDSAAAEAVKPAANGQTLYKRDLLTCIRALFCFDRSPPPPALSGEALKIQNNTKFVQDLNEVQMLLDHISGHPSKNLALLKVKLSDPNEKELPSAEVVDRVAKIGVDYAKTADGQSGSQINEKDAAFLIIVKDALNSIAYPATGSTIAFTTLFTRSLEANRAQSAAIAYPSLVKQAAALKCTKNFLISLALVIAVLAALMLWQVAYGVQLASHFDEAKKNDTAFAGQIYDQMEKENSAAQSGGKQEIANLNDVCGLKSGPPPSKDANAATRIDRVSSEPKAPSIAMQRICDVYAYQHNLLCVAVADLGKYGSSFPFSIYKVILPMHDLWQADVCGNGKTAWDKGHQEDAKSIAAVLVAMSNYFLPLLFGIVGALASLVRSLSDKVADSLLSPRDLTLWLIRLPISVVAGVCVGLFLTPGSAQGSSIGSFAISASGISFLAGYGAESFFTLLDTLIARLFNVGQTGKAVLDPK